MPNYFPSREIRLPGRQSDKVRPGKTSPTTSVIELRRPSMEHIKRPSLAGLTRRTDSKDRSSKDRKGDRSISKDKHAKEAREPPKPKAIKLGMFMESPPVLLIGTERQSTGAIISGRLQITPTVVDATIDWIHMYLECTSATKRPVSDRCRECMTKVDDLTEWKFLTKPKTFLAQDGTSELPFSWMIPGSMPITTHGHTGSIDYSLHVRAMISDGTEVEFRREVIIQRAIPPGPEKNSVRVFPPTNLQLHVTLPSIVHPMGDFPVQCRMTGVVTKQKGSETRWRLRKLVWKVEESETSISPACSKHAGKVGGEGKGIQHESTRDVGNDELKYGWKTNFSEGEIEGEFMCALDPSTKPNCSMEAQNGLKITHNLILECVIAEEWANNKRPDHASPTGSARVLRTQFALTVTERAGMGLSWDDEMPPMYEDVPVSPPHYQNEHTTMENYEGDDLHEDVEHLNLNS